MTTTSSESAGQDGRHPMTGNALDECHAKLVGSAPIIPGMHTNNGTDGFTKTALPEA